MNSSAAKMACSVRHRLNMMLQLRRCSYRSFELYFVITFCCIISYLLLIYVYKLITFALISRLHRPSATSRITTNGSLHSCPVLRRKNNFNISKVFQAFPIYTFMFISIPHVCFWQITQKIAQCQPARPWIVSCSLKLFLTFLSYAFNIMIR